MQTIYWPCRVTRERSGYYLVTPISAYPCASSGASLDDAISRPNASFGLRFRPIRHVVEGTPDEAFALAKPYPAERMHIVHKGEKKDAA